MTLADTRLQRLIQAWETLPEEIKHAIDALSA